MRKYVLNYLSQCTIEDPRRDQLFVICHHQKKSAMFFHSPLREAEETAQPQRKDSSFCSLRHTQAKLFHHSLASRLEQGSCEAFFKVSLDQLDFKQFLQVTQMNPISNESIIVKKHFTFSDLFQEMPPFCGRKILILTYSLVTKRFRCIKGWSSRTELHCLQKVQAWNMQVS